MKYGLSFFFWYIAIFAVCYLFIVNIQIAVSYYWNAPTSLDDIGLGILIVCCIPISFLFAKKMITE